ncbi:MAG: hypothetical protein ACKO6N_01615 [Myxococcota bacterium]
MFAVRAEFKLASCMKPVISTRTDQTFSQLLKALERTPEARILLFSEAHVPLGMLTAHELDQQLDDKLLSLPLAELKPVAACGLPVTATPDEAIECLKHSDYELMWLYDEGGAPVGSLSRTELEAVVAQRLLMRHRRHRHPMSTSVRTTEPPPRPQRLPPADARARTPPPACDLGERPQRGGAVV